NKKSLKLHRFIKSEWKMIDHINRNGLDNRECNLRETNPKLNRLNCKLRSDNTSGYNGICFDKSQNRWIFQWNENNKQKYKYFQITKNRTSEQAKQLAIDFKLEHDKKTGNMN
ncbi:1002_t:CDS:1, partial [Racocetra fulgida]